MTKQFLALLILVDCILTKPAQAESLSSTSFLPTQGSFELIDNEYRMAEAWATCSAVYEIYSDLLYDPGSASSELLKNLSRGAEVAVATSYVLQLIKEHGDMNLELSFQDLRALGVWLDYRCKNCLKAK